MKNAECESQSCSKQFFILLFKNSRPSVVKISPRLENLFDIIHEDAGLLVINKPAGLVCHPTKGAGFPTEDGSAYGNRTRLSALRGPCPNR
jgi:23S rRNA-/tRNA-specific pseudouridylate synthase